MYDSGRVLCSENYCAISLTREECPCWINVQQRGVIMPWWSTVVIIIIVIINERMSIWCFADSCNTDNNDNTRIMNWTSTDTRKLGAIVYYIIIKYMMCVFTHNISVFVQWKTIGFNFHVFHFCMYR